MSFRNPITTINAVREPVTVAGGTITAVTDPVTAGGGHVDTTGSVTNPVTVNGGTITSITDPVTAGGGHVDTITDPVTVNGGTVGSVTNPVTVNGGTVTSITDAVTVSGGTVTSITDGVTVVGGTVNEVLNVSGTVNTVEVVTQSVPQLGRDLFSWPGISGEPFPPTRSQYGYGSSNGFPCYTADANFGSSPATLTFPHNPRLPAGKSTTTVSLSLWLDVSGYDTTTLVCAGKSVAVTGFVGYPLQASLAGVTALGSAADTLGTFVAIKLVMNADGSGSLTVGSGAPAALPAGTLPAATGDALTSLTTKCSYSANTISSVAAVQVTYT